MRVAGVWRYPVKSMQGQPVDAIELEEAGSVTLDRAWAVRESASGKVLTARTVPALLHARASVVGDDVRITLPDGRELLGDDERTDLALSAFVGRPVHLARAKPDETTTLTEPIDFEDGAAKQVSWQSRPTTFNDGHPVHLVSTASLRGGAELHPGGEWDARRFRPNVLVDVDGDDFPEESWSTVQIGHVALVVYKRTTRCQITARAQPGLRDDLEVPRALARNRNAELGVYARVSTGGHIAAGDDVRVIA